MMDEARKDVPMKKEELSLDGDWSFRPFAFGEGQDLRVYERDHGLVGWFRGIVPGTVQGDLARLKHLPNSYWDRNARQYRAVEEKEWWYARDFDVPAPLLQKTVSLRFEGIDTIADIYLNGRKIGFAQNMFTPYEFEVTELLSEKGNRLAIRFDSPVRVGTQRDKRGIVALCEKKIHPDKQGWHTCAYVRKGNYAYGGDMAQRMITVGLWRSVALVAHETARIRHCQVVTRPEETKAVVNVTVDLERLSPDTSPLTVRLEVSDPRGGRVGEVVSLTAEQGQESVQTAVTVEHPELWWPNGVGTPSLHSLKIEVLSNDDLLDTWEERFGIREVELLQEDDQVEEGKTFTFAVNGVKVFAKGANWVPADHHMTPVTRERYEKLLGSAKDANINMFRMNGYGVYEDDLFYELCDEYGIMLWHDFMFSDCMYPDDDPEFMAECGREAEIVVRRLRNHPCIVLWCGNNEIDEIYYLSGHKNPEVWGIWGESLFHELLPEICRRLDPGTPYWPSSAWSAPGVFPLAEELGDRHCYAWNANVYRALPGGGPYGGQYGESVQFPKTLENISYRLYARDKGKFYSECGQRGVPAVATLKELMKADQMWPPDKEAWSYHSTQCHWGPDAFEKWNILISEYVDIESLGTIEDFVFWSQVSQAHCLKYVAELCRTREFSCSGALFWQYNECWPANTYSIVDYFLRKKAAWYWLRKAFSPLLVAFIENEGKVELWVMNDRHEAVEARCEIACMTFSGETLAGEELTADSPGASATKIKEWELAAFEGEESERFLHAALVVQGEVVSENTFFFALHKDLAFPQCRLETEIEQTGPNEYAVSVTTDNYARLVTLELAGEPDCRLSNNFFDLPPKRQETIELRFPDGRSLPDVERTLIVRTFNG